MRFLIAFLVFSVSVFSACTATETTAPSAEAKRYPLKGTVVSVNRSEKKAAIAHEKIPDFMEAMTMDFKIREDWVWDDLTPGSEVRATLVVDNEKGEYWLENIGIISAPDPNKPAPPINENFVQIGKPIPDFTLTNQDGKKISLKDFQGKALAITFIYAQCPLPDYCIRMSTNFSDVANDVALNEEYRDKFALLSISFDPERDTPEKLRSYGLGYLGKDSAADFSIWQLAVGDDKEVRRIADFFGLRYEVDANDKTQFSHSLRTAVISPDGKVTKIFPGNDWTPDDLYRELKFAYEGKPSEQ